ncbi:MAG: glycosyltransferase family 4 protein [Beduini sp.]|uniref:glycosyltransferase family 4 protein n=1 Tax=Beduini sp. TaxID=1922300 RepID=UPI003990BC74
MTRNYCIFSAQYLPHLGGVERYTYNLSKKLLENGNRVTIVTSNVQKLPAYERIMGVDVYRMPCFNLLAGRYPILKLSSEFRKINKKLKSENFDFVIVNTRFYIHSLYAAWFAKRKRIECVVIEHGTSHLTIHNPFWDKIGQIYEHGLTFFVKCLCHRYYGVSEACNEWLQHFNIEAEGTLHNAIDLKQINQILKTSKKKFRDQFSLSRDAVIITFTGRLLKEKGILTLIESVKKINATYPEVYLFIAGEGDLDIEIQGRTNKNIIQLGRLSFEDIIILLSESNIFCLPSDSEGFSTSILEAAACNNYIITTRRGGAGELLLNDQYGLVIDHNDFESVYHAILCTIQNKEKLQQATALTYEQLIHNFTWGIIADKVEKL